MKFEIILIILCASCTKINAWDDVDLEIFDLVEEINENFYELLGVPRDAKLSEIKRAFRNLSIIVHPDKSNAPDANVKFRNLVSVYEVLKDSNKREKYDLVLKNGMPDWKSAIYYYRRVRKMGLMEMGIILFVIITIGQYIIAWAVYVEKKYTAETILGSKLKRLQKKTKGNVDVDALLSGIPTPSVKNTLPFQIPRAIWNTPRAIINLFQLYSDYKQEKLEILEREAKELEKQKLLEEQFAKEKEMKKEGMRKRKEKFSAKEKTDEELKGYSKLNMDNVSKGTVKAVQSKDSSTPTGGIWTDDDLAELIRLVKKYPSGASSRWDTIADALNRSVQEVTFMAAKMKENGYRVPGQTDSVAEQIIQESVKKVKVKTVDNPILQVPETNWSQEQQQLLEVAIVKYPKSGAADRWQKISNTVPGKTKEECLARYKYLVEIVKAQKLKQQQEQQQQQSSIENDSTKLIEAERNGNNSMPQLTDEEIDEKPKSKSGGKPRNKRRERKQQMEFSSNEDSDN